MGMTGEQAYVLAKKLIEAGGGGGGTVDAYTKTQTDNLLLKKVDKEDGKGLFSGSYNDLTDAPTIPSKTSELQNDSGYLTEHQDLTDYAKKTDFDVISKKVDNNTTNIADIKATLSNAISDVWNNSITYAVGQYCIYENKYWKCLVQHSGQTPTEGTYWTQTSVDEEMVNVNSSINDVKNTLENLNMINPTISDNISVANAVSVYKLGKVAIINVNGIKTKSTGTGIHMLSDVPKSKYRGFGVLTSADGTESTTFYFNNIDYTKIMINSTDTNILWYGQLVYFTE